MGTERIIRASRIAHHPSSVYCKSDRVSIQKLPLKRKERRGGSIFASSTTTRIACFMACKDPITSRSIRVRALRVDVVSPFFWYLFTIQKVFFFFLYVRRLKIGELIPIIYSIIQLESGVLGYGLRVFLYRYRGSIPRILKNLVMPFFFFFSFCDMTD